MSSGDLQGLSGRLRYHLNGGADGVHASPSDREYYRQVLVSAAALEAVGISSVVTYQLLDVPLLAWVIGAAMVVVPSGLWWLDWKRNRPGSAHLCASVVWLTVSMTSISNGGIGETGHAWLYTVPLIAGLIGGLRPLLAWSAITVATLLTIAEGGVGPLQVRTVLPPEGMPLLRVANLTLLVLTFGLMTWAFLRNRRVAEQEAGEALLKLSAEVEVRRVAEARAKAADQAKSLFLATMSHEIRTPMNGVLGMAELLLEQPLGEQERRFAEIIQSSGEALLSLLNDILDYSKIEAGRMELDEQSFDLEAIAEAALNLTAGRASDKKLELILEVDPSTEWQVRGDGARLRQVLLNLLGNAVKFTDRGEVSLLLKRRPAAEGKLGIRIEVRDTGPGISAEACGRLFAAFVQANAKVAQRFGGTGLGLAISRRIVELMGGTIGVESELGRGSCFWLELALPQVAAETPGPLAGAPRVLVLDAHPQTRAVLLKQLEGLGAQGRAAPDWPAAQALLADETFDLLLFNRYFGDMDLAQSLASLGASGARLVMIPAWGEVLPPEQARHVDALLTKPISRAALRTALLPKVAPAPVVSPSPQPAAAPDGPLILVADDNPVNRKVASMYLARLGYRSIEAEDGVQALALLEGGGIALVLMDIEMPELGGYEATKRLRAREGKSVRTPVIALTAHAMAGYREQVLAAGMDDYLSKPLRRNELAAALVRALGDPIPTPARGQTLEPSRVWLRSVPKTG